MRDERVAPQAMASILAEALGVPRPASASLQPVSAAEYGIPQAFTWNMGTTGSTLSRALRHITSGKAAA